MNKVSSRLAIVFALLVLQTQVSFAQDKTKNRQNKESNTTKEGDTEEDNTDTDDDGADEEPAKGQNGGRVWLGLESGAGISVLQIGGKRSHVNISATIGGYADIRMAGRFYVQPGLFYTLNGGSEVTFDQVTRYPHGVIINMIEVPLTFAYKTGTIRSKARFTIGVGGYAGYNAGAAINSIDLRIGDNDTNDIKRIDAGACMNVGVEIRNGLFFRLKSQWGLLDMQPAATGPAIYTESHILTIGYLIGNRDRHYKTRRAGTKEDAMSRRM